MAHLSGLLAAATLQSDGTPFARSVVLIATDDEQRTLGTVLNKPSEEAVPSFVPVAADALALPAVLYWGGVAEGMCVLGLNTRGGMQLWGGGSSLSDAAPGTLRVFSGGLVWAPTQLALEAVGGFWTLHRPESSDVYDADPATLWERVSSRPSV